MTDIIISAHGGRWSTDQKDFNLFNGSEVLFYVSDGELLSNHNGYEILESLQNGQTPTQKVVEKVNSSNPTYDYSCWYAEEFKDHCGIYEVGSHKRLEDLSKYDEDSPLLLSQICQDYPNRKIYWVCCREVTPKKESQFLLNSPGAFLNPILWSNDQGGAEVFPLIQDKKSFAVELIDKAQISSWNRVLDSKEGSTDDEEKEVTLAIIQAAQVIVTLLTLASLMAYALSRGYTVTAKTTKTTMQFEFKPKEQVSYRVSGVYTFSSFNDEDDVSLDAKLMDKDGKQIGTLQIVREI